MTGFLLDTNCISEVVRLKPDPHLMAWIEAAEEGLLYLSVLTLGEIRKGLAALPQGKRRSRLETWLELELQARFSGRILSIDAAVMIAGACSPPPQRLGASPYPRSTACWRPRRSTIT